MYRLQIHCITSKRQIYFLIVELELQWLLYYLNPPQHHNTALQAVYSQAY